MPRGSIVGAALALAAAVLVLALQPLGGSWWNWADPDGAYVGSSLNILIGNHTNYLDHPGLPTQDALAVGHGAKYLIGKATGAYDDRQSFVDGQMLDLDQARPLYRGWAVLVFLGGTLIVYAVVSRLLSHWTWGLAGSLVFLVAPGLATISFLLRPDSVLSALCLGVGYLAVTAFELRRAVRYTAAALLLGLAMTVKLTAIGMVVPLAVAAAWKPPDRQWFGEIRTTLSTFARRHVLWLVPTAVVWVALCWTFNRERLPIVQTDDQRSILLTGATFIGAYALFAVLAERLRIPWADRIFRPFFAWLMVAFVVGLAIPASLVLDDGVQMLVAMKETLTGGRVNEGIEPFSEFTLDSFLRYPLSVTAVVLVLGLAAGVVGIMRRRYWPVLLALGALVLALMAAARYSYDYYYAPAFVVAIPGALWLFARRGARTAPLYVWIPVLLLFALSISHFERFQGGREDDVDAPAQALADELLRPGEVILVPHYYFPVEDVRFDSLVDGFVDHVPAYPYRFLSRPSIAAERGLTPAYYVAPDDDLPAGRSNVDIGGYGPFLIEKLPRRWGPDQRYGVARIVASVPRPDDDEVAVVAKVHFGEVLIARRVGVDPKFAS